MFKQRPTLRTLHKGSTVRHLLVEGADNAAKTLSKLERGVRTVVATGPHHEIDQKAMALSQEWCQKEDFSWAKDKAPVEESQNEIVILATLMGHTSLFEGACFPRPIVPLDRWEGCKDRNGDDYVYSYTGTTIEARPNVRARHSYAIVSSSDRQELCVPALELRELSNTLGPNRRFFLDCSWGVKLSNPPPCTDDKDRCIVT